MSKTHLGILEVDQVASLPNLRSNKGGYGFEGTTPKYWDGSSWSAFSGSGSGGVATFDALYDLDQTMTIDGTGLTFTLTHATENLLNLAASGTATGDVLQFANSGTGKDIAGTSDTWSISKAGALLVKTIAHPTTNTAITLDGNGSGKVTIAGTSTGNIELQRNVTMPASKSITMTGVAHSNAIDITAGDISMSDGSVTVVDNDNANSLAVTNATITTGNMAALTADAITTGDILYLDNGGASLTTGSYVNCNDDGVSVFKVGVDGATAIATAINSTVGLKITGIQTSEDAVQVTTSGVTASDKASLLLNPSGSIASGSNILRVAPSGTPNASAIAIEYVGASKTCQALYLDGDSTAADVAHINGGGALTDGLAVLGLTNDGNLATGGSILNLTMGGTPHAAANALEITAAKDAQAVVISSAAVTNHAVQITDTAAIADNKAALYISATGTLAAAGSNVVRIDASGCTATNKPIMLELVGTGKDVSGMYSVSDNTTTHGVSIAGAGALASGGRMLTVTNTGTPAANTDSVAEVTFGGTATNNPVVLNVNNGTANAAPLLVTSNVATATRAACTIVQDSTTGAVAPLELKQDDVDTAILKITAAAGASGGTIDTDDKSGGTGVYIKIMIGAVAYWIKATPGA